MKFTFIAVLSLVVMGGSWWGIDSYERHREYSRAEAIRRQYEKGHLQAKIANDELVMQDARLNVEIAERQHRKPDSLAVTLAEERLRADRLELDMVLDRDRLEGTVSQ
jgi:hypothetical protein